MAAGATYVPIATTTLGSNATNIVLSSIPSTYTDLVLITNLQSNRGNYSADPIIVNLNGDSSSSYSSTRMRGDGSSAGTDRNTSNTRWSFDEASTDPSSTSYFTIIKFDFLNYSNTSTYKTVLVRGIGAVTSTHATVGLWRNTSAINSITLAPQIGTNFRTGSSVALYGIVSA